MQLVYHISNILQVGIQLTNHCWQQRLVLEGGMAYIFWNALCHKSTLKIIFSLFDTLYCLVSHNYCMQVSRNSLIERV